MVGMMILDFDFDTECVVLFICSAMLKLLLIVQMISWNSVISCVLDIVLSAVNIERPCKEVLDYVVHTLLYLYCNGVSWIMTSQITLIFESHQ